MAASKTGAVRGKVGETVNGPVRTAKQRVKTGAAKGRNAQSFAKAHGKRSVKKGKGGGGKSG